MTALRASVLLRAQLVESTAELATMNSTKLPDGATVFDNETDTLWRLDKNAGSTFDAALTGSGVMLKPDDGTDARWFAESIAGGSPYYSASYAVAADAVVMTAGQWNYLGSTAGTFGRSGGDGHAFTVDTTTGEVTYHGPPRLVLVTAQCSVLNGAAANSISIHACISRNDDVVAGAGGDYSILGEQATVTADVTVQLSAQRILLLNPGTTLRLAFRNATNDDDLSVSFYQMCVVPL